MKKPGEIKGIRRSCSFVVVIALIMTGFAININTISDRLDLTSLNIEGVSPNIGIKDVKTKTVEYHLDPSYKIYQMGDYVYLKVGDLKPSIAPGEPMLPMKTIIVELPKGACIKGVFVKEGSYIEIKEKLKIVPTPQPVSWSDIEMGKMVPNETIYNSNKYFPGKALSYEVGEDNSVAYLFIRFFPVQYIPSQKRAILVTDAEIEIRYTVEEFSYGYSFDAGENPTHFGENLIITTQDLFEEASRLEDFHDDEVPTDVVSTTWIYEK